MAMKMVAVVISYHLIIGCQANCKYLSLTKWWQTPEMIESLDLSNIDILLQLPCAVLIRKRPPAHEIMSHFFTSDRITGNGNIQHTLHFHIVRVKRLLLLHLQPTLTVLINQKTAFYNTEIYFVKSVIKQ